ncbi:MAG: DNA-directed RNA polymerase subunit G [Candidatus Helarchaeota archaeon]
MLELTGVVEKIEKSSIRHIDLIYFTMDNNKTRIRLELPLKNNPFQEAQQITIVFNPSNLQRENQKLVLNGYLYSIEKKDDLNKILISIGGLQLIMETPNQYDELSTKKDLTIQFI